MERCASSSTSRKPSKVGAVCGNAARTVLCGGRSAMIVPTATTDSVSSAHGYLSFLTITSPGYQADNRQLWDSTYDRIAPEVGRASDHLDIFRGQRGASHWPRYSGGVPGRPPTIEKVK
jgi:hypothetical protein